ncbi:FtsX-like permease family protein [Streptomyces sp. RFCAC02]|uniref:ABC transporter permease n=1 Tax=Streptomyces sp. RFCAC02 TaxID=2499143 RepID=UPI00101F6FB0|nr:FtsX-like permease family protein [Streptomyces sp. RFCAC02]
MLALALRSVRRRPGRLLATLLSAVLGSTITMTFSSLHDTAAADGVDDVSADSLVTAASVVGGYGLLLVFCAVASTLTVNVRQRETEMATLRSTGATPAQIRRLVVGEAIAVALAGTLVAIAPAVLGGRALLDAFRRNGQVADGVQHVFGPVALATGFGVTLLASTGAALLAVRRASRTAGGRARRRGARRVLACLALAAGASSAGATLAMESGRPESMAPAVYGAILLGVGLALLAPAVLRWVASRLAGPVAAPGRASGFLAAAHLRRRADDLSGVVTALVLFVAMATATLYTQSIESDAISASGLARTVDDKNMQTLNLIVVGIMAVFACIMLVNSLYAATSHRYEEFGRQRLTGATPRQVLAVVGTEGAALAVTGVVLGTVAALAAVVPFSVMRADTLWADGQGPGIWLGITAIALVATVVTPLVTARRGLRTPAVDAVSAAV